ncbi:MAG TPA: sugar ABC transporter substrate-binding protein [Chthoniobacterales bacterium]|nr:sugar ABC transporter substrate-binding protein [Chthoniobacterales bacterium]
MNKAKLGFWSVLAASLLVPLVSFAQTRADIIIVTHGQVLDPFWLVVQNGVEIAAKETGSYVEYWAPERFDLVAMSLLVDAAIVAKPDGLVVSIPDAGFLSKAIEAAVAAGIPVISINSGLEVSKKLGCLMHVGQEEESAGKQAGERMKAMGVKQALILNQEVGNVALDQRTKGFRDGFEGPFHHVQVLSVRIDFKQCHDGVTSYLQKNQDVDGILALGPVAAEPTLKVLDEMGLIGKVKLGTFDVSPLAIQALKKRQMVFALDQQQWLQGYLPVIFLANYAKYGSILQNGLILTGPSFVTPENVERVAKITVKGSH